MDVSKEIPADGLPLFAAVVEETGLPPELASQELSEILGHSGLSADSLTLEQLRAAMLAYLEAFAPVEEGAEEEPAPAPIQVRNPA
jgi:hypothetical protein